MSVARGMVPGGKGHGLGGKVPGGYGPGGMAPKWVWPQVGMVRGGGGCGPRGAGYTLPVNRMTETCGSITFLN